jgi:microfibrillar-associated protein 1
VDDTDGVEPEKEYELWKARELQRLRRDYEEMLKIQKQQQEIERRRTMTKEERRQEDEEKRRSDEDARKNRGKMRLFQKWYHKGAFYQDTGDVDLLHRDFNAPTLEDRSDKTLLPSIMQVKDFGKRGRSKWTHLVAEDTSKKGDVDRLSRRNLKAQQSNDEFERPSSKKARSKVSH